MDPNPAITISFDEAPAATLTQLAHPIIYFSEDVSHDHAQHSHPTINVEGVSSCSPQPAPPVINISEAISHVNTQHTCPHPTVNLEDILPFYPQPALPIVNISESVVQHGWSTICVENSPPLSIQPAHPSIDVIETASLSNAQHTCPSITINNAPTLSAEQQWAPSIPDNETHSLLTKNSVNPVIIVDNSCTQKPAHPTIFIEETMSTPFAEPLNSFKTCDKLLSFTTPGTILGKTETNEAPILFGEAGRIADDYSTLIVNAKASVPANGNDALERINDPIIGVIDRTSTTESSAYIPLSDNNVSVTNQIGISLQERSSPSVEHMIHHLQGVSIPPISPASAARGASGQGDMAVAHPKLLPVSVPAPLRRRKSAFRFTVVPVEFVN
jgi:hypothetical protein